MYTVLMILSSVVSIVLMVIVLLQSGQGGGLAGTFGGPASMGQMFGTRRTADFLSKATWWLGGILVFLAILINMFFLPGATTATQRESIIQQSSRQALPQQPSLPQQMPQVQQNQGSKTTAPTTKPNTK